MFGCNMQLPQQRVYGVPFASHRKQAKCILNISLARALLQVSGSSNNCSCFCPVHNSYHVCIAISIRFFFSPLFSCFMIWLVQISPFFLLSYDRVAQEKYYNAPTYRLSRASITGDFANLAATVVGENSLPALKSGFNDSQTDNAARISFKVRNSYFSTSHHIIFNSKSNAS